MRCFYLNYPSFLFLSIFFQGEGTPIPALPSKPTQVSKLNSNVHSSLTFLKVLV
uniref:Uncharacterized protein n=1 Tax=Macaca fascicularis TaxID=9541 RepID=Q9GMS4_MACFA|nr:hypothetical protein [Macaca fascicularis]